MSKAVLGLALSVLLFSAGPLCASGTVGSGLLGCARVASGGERLACYDRLAASEVARETASPEAGPVTDTVLAVAANERARASADARFRMAQTPSSIVEGSRVLMSAPALGAERPKPLMTVACVDRITRLQLIVHPPVAPAQVQVALFLDGAPLGTAQQWQVLEGGRVIDAGRGLPAIDLLRRVKGGGELRVQSDFSAIDGLRFDATGLTELIAAQRKACRW
jgi:type VI secretion system protein VasI